MVLEEVEGRRRYDLLELGLKEVRNELVDRLPENLLIITPNRTQQAHARLARVHRFLQFLNVLWLRRVARILHLVDDAEMKEALVDYFEKKMLLVDAILLDLKVMRLEQVVHELEVFMDRTIVEVLRQDDREELN